LPPPEHHKEKYKKGSPSLARQTSDWPFVKLLSGNVTYQLEFNFAIKRSFVHQGVYTDGVPEATAADGEMFGTERMILALNTCGDKSPEAILGGIRNAVDTFVGNAEQFDDLTMMCLEYRGPQESKSV